MFVQSTRAAEIAGLTDHQLKEWCIRRGLIRPDVLPRGRGHNALFGWQALLTLRLLAVIHNQFGGTVAHWGPILDDLRRSLGTTSFPSLYGSFVVFDGQKMVVTGNRRLDAKQALLALPLDEHLETISRALAADDQEIQLSLLRPLLVKR